MAECKALTGSAVKGLITSLLLYLFYSNYVVQKMMRGVPLQVGALTPGRGFEVRHYRQ